ncbi:MAG: glycosyl hydrolase 2 galactose-binding domain-containing protein [Flavobacteriales bacterium]
MKSSRIQFFLFVLITVALFSCKSSTETENKTISINDGWLLTSEGGKENLDDLPFSLLESLYNLQELSDPNYEDDFLNFNILSDKYTLSKTIFVEPGDLENKNVFLKLGRINGNANVFLNDHLIAVVESFYQEKEISISEHIRGGSNLLEIKFALPTSKSKANNLQKATLQRPAFSNLEVWAGFELKMIDKVDVERPYLSYNSYTDGKLDVTWMIPMQTKKGEEVTLEWHFNDQVFKRELVTQEDFGLQILPFHINNPLFWFPYTHGTPHLYSGTLKVFAGGDLQLSEDISFGVKTLKWNSNNNQIEFVVNGKSIDVFAINFNETNWYKTTTLKELETYIEEIKVLGVNCIRLSGNQAFLTEEKLKLFDKAGIFVWQDLQITTLPKSWTTTNKSKIQNELLHLSKLYRNHPSVLSLGGKSEDRSDTTDLSGKIHYEIFEQVVPQIVNTFSDLEYIPNASYVWNDMPFNYGALSMSSYQFLDVWLRFKEKDPYSNSWSWKMKNSKMAEEYYESIGQSLGLPSDLEALLYYSEIHQKNTMNSLLALKRGINPKTIHLPVSYQESSPGIHPSLSDFFGHKKYLFYTLLNQNKPLAIIQKNRQSILSYEIKNNSKANQNVNAKILVKNIKGDIVDELTFQFDVEPKQSKSILEWHEKLIPKHWKLEGSVVLEFHINDDVQRILLPKNINSLDFPSLKYKSITKNGKDGLEIISESFVPYTKLSTNHLGYFETNFLTLLPQDTLEIPFHSLDTTYHLTSESIYLYDYSQSF